MAGTEAEGYEAEGYGAWYDALDALTSVVKLFRDGVLTAPDDRALLQRLEQAERAARPSYRGGVAPWWRGSGSPSISEAILTSPSALAASVAPPGAAELAALGPQFTRATSGLERAERQRLTRRYEGATNAVLKQSPRAAQSLKGFRSVVAEVLIGATGEELARQIDHVVAIIQARGH
jgi:hypothetical protein